MDEGSQPSASPTSEDYEILLRKERVLRVLQEFALGMLQTKSVDDLLWEVVARTIGQLGYEDCVIYLVDPERGTLVQRAAHGPKNPREHMILNRIELSVGEGIVGAVAQSGQGLIIPDVSKDPRYVIDDQARASEMAVPIVHDGVVLGVLDSESSELDAYSEDDFEIFRTVASMLASRLAVEMERGRTLSKLRQASYAAEDAAEVKASFLANVSHEVRTPLVAVIGIAEVLQGLIDGKAPPSVLREHVRVIERSGQHLLKLINQILDLAKHERGEMRVDSIETSPRALLREVADLFAAKAKKRKLTFCTRVKTEIPERFVTDPTRVRQVLVNLVDNALKFTAEGEVCVLLSGSEAGAESPASLCFEVVDTGSGVPADEHERIFESFHQLDASLRREHGGLGLGLAISRVLARRMGGDLRLDRDYEGGSRFLFELVELAAPGAAPTEEQMEHDLRGSAHLQRGALGGRLLLAEDNHDSRRLIAFQLRHAGFEVEEVEDGEQALEQVRVAPHRFDSVLLDMQMPKVDGFEVARELRRRGFERPILALTAHSFPGDREQCLAAGCTDYFTKPLHWQELFDRLNGARSE